MSSEMETKLLRYERLNRFAVKGQTVFAGSSLIEQFPVHELMAAEGMSGIVYNRGIGGYTTEDLMDTLDTCILDLEPSTLVISIGTNDLNCPGCSLMQLERNVRYIILRIQEALPDTRMIWIAFYPVNPDAALDGDEEVFKYRTNGKIDEANRMFSAMMGMHGITVLDANSLLMDDDGRLKREYTIDGIHMYADGYRPVFDLLRPLIWGDTSSR